MGDDAGIVEPWPRDKVFSIGLTDSASVQVLVQWYQHVTAAGIQRLAQRLVTDCVWSVKLTPMTILTNTLCSFGTMASNVYVSPSNLYKRLIPGPLRLLELGEATYTLKNTSKT